MTEEAQPGMSEEERIALCQKLDKELDDFIDGLEKKRYTEGWPEDRWEEEMAKHPFFMKGNVEDGEMSPLAEGLARLKYDPEENTPRELAISYKEDGNFNFKHKNYRLAILGYTEGIKVKCGDNEIDASLYNNRAAANWHLKNYRTALADSEKALSLMPSHTKARLRAAKCAFEILKYDTCISQCEYLLNSSANKEVTELLNKATKFKKLQERDERKSNKKRMQKEEQRNEVVKAIIERGIRISNCEDEEDIELANLEPCIPGGLDAKVRIENSILLWPVLILYHEHQLSELIKACPENVSLIDQFEQLFPAPWDKENKYACDRINVYFEGYDKMPHVVDTSKTLGEILKNKYLEVKGGTPCFFILPRGSSVERGFLESFI